MPSPADLAAEGLKAFDKRDYPKAIELYTQALAGAQAPDYYLKRSIAYQRLQQHQEALQDAELVVSLANKRGKRELIGSGQLRRGISLLQMERYGDADLCFSDAEKKIDPKSKEQVGMGMWRKKYEAALKAVDQDDVRREVTIEVIPNVEAPQGSHPSQPTPATETSQPSSIGGTANTSTTTPSVMTPANKIRYEWYQTPTHVVLTLYVKGAPKSKTTIDIKENALSISFPLPNSSEYRFEVDPLFASIVLEESSSTVFNSKIEVKLAKANAGAKWADIEGFEAPKAESTAPEEKVEKKKETPLGPVYPTSSKSGPKDWDKIAVDLVAKPKQNTDGSSDNPGNDSDDEGDPVSQFFKKLYKDANEDTRRAMMKSYVESNGTSLSTNWDQVGKDKVETSPPDGMVAKKWDQ